ncbi:hypothetical protein [Bradyrhizobium sp. SZCCHNRI3042]|uniref:hypothetical protein n=1 Tax=Bradyrhizobium sp. SZCCHNRI3042 TaxID=3057291 RepID=UPI0029165C4D|nr:hypothetical protein [Bradyrhizobium sp. SZCCHNRI3042]
MGETFFDSFEEREDYLRSNLKVPLQRRCNGLPTFFADFRSAMNEHERPACALITPNPIDYLPFDRVRLILNAAARLGQPRGEEELQKVVMRFQLERLLQRQIYTLSGGEIFRVAMAKCALEAHALKRLYFAGPWGTLATSNRMFVDELLSAYSAPELSYELLSLSGDASQEAEIPEEAPRDASVAFGISLANLSIPLSDNPNSGAKSVAKFDDFEASAIASPCLIVGNNGHGKSLLSKALANAIPHEGHARITGRQTERVRLIFQDVSNQALLSAASLDWSLRNNTLARSIRDRLARDISRTASAALLDAPSLLGTKIDLIALRLAERPAGVVLDEPDWGLTKVQAIALIDAVTKECDQDDIPLLLVSHRPWFDRRIRSRLLVLRNAVTPSEMRISISRINTK